VCNIDSGGLIPVVEGIQRRAGELQSVVDRVVLVWVVESLKHLGGFNRCVSHR
jgi:hypothetical protein